VIPVVVNDSDLEKYESEDTRNIEEAVSSIIGKGNH
jgi:hypothetical protein